MEFFGVKSLRNLKKRTFPAYQSVLYSNSVQQQAENTIRARLGIIIPEICTRRAYKNKAHVINLGPSRGLSWNWIASWRHFGPPTVHRNKTLYHRGVRHTISALRINHPGMLHPDYWTINLARNRRFEVPRGTFSSAMCNNGEFCCC